MTAKLNAQSRPTTTVDSSKVQSWMFPAMLLDIASGDFYKKLATVQAEQISKLKSRIRTDSLSRAGQSVTSTECEQEVKQLRVSNAEGWKLATYWQDRYRKANTERWLLRGLGVGAGYIGIRKGF